MVLRMIELDRLDSSSANQYGAKAANLGHVSGYDHFNIPHGWVVREGQKFDRILSIGKRYIVRSSMVGEDSAETSMAGDFISEVCLASEVPKVIEKVMYYKPYANVSLRNVIVQEYIEGISSGEYFSVNPDTGCITPIWSSVLGNGGSVDGTKTFHSTVPPLRLKNIAANLKTHFHSEIDIEWVYDGKDYWIVQVRPITVISSQKLKVLSGIGILQEFASGAVYNVKTPDEYFNFHQDFILVAEHTDRTWESLMRKAKGLITDHGTRTCHAAIFSREIGLPAVIGTLDATQCLKNNEKVFIDTLTSAGDGFVYKEVNTYG